MRTLSAQRISRISRVVADLSRAEAFYRDALRFEAVSRGVSNTAKLGLGEAEEVVLRLGSADIAMVRFAVPGLPYPSGSRSNDLWFQHLAIVVSDMDAAYAHLLQAGSWRAITQNGPQLLPPENGNVRAFKFRDPDGHPLELIWFPNRGQGLPLFQGVDHSALSISSTHRGLAFYRSLGFRVSNRSLNHGSAQGRLDGLDEARVEVIGLQPASGARPGLELLGYQPPGRPARQAAMNDIVTDWVTIEVATLSGGRHRAVRDPDGHFLLLVDQGAGLSA